MSYTFGLLYWINPTNKEIEFIVAKKYATDAPYSLFYHSPGNFINKLWSDTLGLISSSVAELEYIINECLKPNLKTFENGETIYYIYMNYNPSFINAINGFRQYLDNCATKTMSHSSSKNPIKYIPSCEKDSSVVVYYDFKIMTAEEIKKTLSTWNSSSQSALKNFSQAYKTLLDYQKQGVHQHALTNEQVKKAISAIASEKHVNPNVYIENLRKLHTNYYNSLKDKYKSSILYYTGSGYIPINNYLRGEDTSGYDVNTLKNHINNINQVLNNAPPLEQTIFVYRGLNLDKINKFKHLKEGDVIDLFRDSFNSTSFTIGISSGNFAGSECCLFILHLSPGTKGLYIGKSSSVSHEDEFILAPGPYFEIIKYKNETVPMMGKNLSKPKLLTYRAICVDCENAYNKYNNIVYYQLVQPALAVSATPKPGQLKSPKYTPIDIHGKIIPKKNNVTSGSKLSNPGALISNSKYSPPPEGPFSNKYANGSVMSTGTYVNGKLNGKYVEFYENNKPKREAFYINGELEGKYVEYYENGKVNIIDHYKGGKRNGSYEKYYDNGQPEINTTYKDNLIDGFYMSYHKNGKLYIKTTYKSNVTNGEYDEYYENGKPKQKIQYINGYPNGIYISYYDNGSPHVETTYNMGKYNGKYVEYYKNGNKKTVAQQVNGTFNGPYITYYENGNLHTESFYDMGKRNGKYTENFENGKHKTLGQMINNVFYGPLEEYHPNGSLYKKYVVVNGYFDGSYKEYFDNNQLKIDTTYKDHAYDNAYKEYYKNGQPQKIANYSNKLLNGQYKEYFENGQLKFNKNYSYGKLNGICEEYFENGKPKLIEKYDNGKKNGPVKSFDTNGNLISTKFYLDDKVTSESNYMKKMNIPLVGSKEIPSISEHFVLGLNDQGIKILKNMANGCKFNSIKNPESGKCVFLTLPTGKKILDELKKKYPSLPSLQPPSSQPPPPQPPLSQQPPSYDSGLNFINIEDKYLIDLSDKAKETIFDLWKQCSYYKNNKNLIFDKSVTKGQKCRHIESEKGKQILKEVNAKYPKNAQPEQLCALSPKQPIVVKPTQILTNG